MEHGKLSKHLEGKVKLNGILPGEIHLPGIGKVDLRETSYERIKPYVEGPGKLISPATKSVEPEKVKPLADKT